MPRIVIATRQAVIADRFLGIYFQRVYESEVNNMKTVVIKPGDRYGRLSVIKEVEPTETGVRRFLCQCDCGNKTIVRMCHLRSAKHPTVSCGCFSKEQARTNGLKHGYASDKQPYEKLYRVWGRMKERCNNPHSNNYYLYGGRGISVCDAWRNDYAAFRSWAISHGYKQGLTIDRIDSNGNYEPSNCRWATSIEQQNNLRTNVNITYNNETHSIASWARITGIQEGTIRKRYKKGLPLEQVFFSGKLRRQKS